MRRKPCWAGAGLKSQHYDQRTVKDDPGGELTSKAAIKDESSF